jgi:hypothetical protein
MKKEWTLVSLVVSSKRCAAFQAVWRYTGAKIPVTKDSSVVGVVFFADRTSCGTMTLRIERSVRQGIMVFTLSGRMTAAEIAELKALFATDYRNLVLDLRDLGLADRDSVRFLRDCEADGMKLENCPAYVRDWMEREKDYGSHELAIPI